MDIFDKKDLEFFLPKEFKGMSKQYMIRCIFNEEIQKNWYPSIGDVFVTSTGNIYVVSSKHQLTLELGGTLFFFGGGLCNRDKGNTLDDTYCYTMNYDGIWYEYNKTGKIEAVKNLYHSSWKSFRYIPYPHEI